MTTYILDASVLMQAQRLHYGFDFCPAFWNWLELHHRLGQVASVEKVAEEIERGDDELVEWAKKMGDSFFLARDDKVMSVLEVVSNWADATYEQRFVRGFEKGADYWLVAHALAHNYTVVTLEGPLKLSKTGESGNKAALLKTGKLKTSHIKIPDACRGLGIGAQCITPYDMLRREGAQFILGPSKAVA